MGLKNYLILLLITSLVSSIVISQSFSIDSKLVIPPVLLSVTSIDEYTILVTWQEPIDTSLIQGYFIYRDDGSGFILIGKEQIGSSKFYDYGLKPNILYTYYLTSIDVDGLESLQSNQLSETTTSKNLPKPPTIIGLKSSGTDQITIVWEEPLETSDILTYNIERRIFEKDAFIVIGNIVVQSTSFTDTKLTPSIVYTYRILSKNNLGQTGIPSNEFSGVSSIDLTELDNLGKSIEPELQNKFTPFDAEVIAQTIELFNVNTNSMDQIIDDIEVKKLNAYQVISKMSDGSYDLSQEMKDAGAFYGAIYLEASDITKFTNEIQERVKIAVEGSKGLGAE